MCYITKRVIGMGFPATGCEKIDRNTLEDTKSFLDRYHGDYKIYNLCIEKDRIYPKTYFENSEENKKSEKIVIKEINGNSYIIILLIHIIQ